MAQLTMIQMTKTQFKSILTGAALVAMSLTSPLLEAADLKENITVENDLVKLGDLFTDAGDLADTAVFKAPKPGSVKQIAASEIARLASRYKIDWEKPDYLKRVAVSRDATTFTMADLKQFLNGHIDEAAGLDDYEIRLFGRKGEMFIPTSRDIDEIEVDSFEMKQGNKRFTAIFRIPSSDAGYRRLPVTGAVDPVLEVPVPNVAIEPGDILTKDKIKWVRMSAARVQRSYVQHYDTLIGHTVRRPIDAGKLVRKSDVIRPVAVKKGEMISVELMAGNLQLVITGKAMQNGAIGDMIKVQNMSSRRSFEAKIISADRASVKVNPIKLVAAR